MLRCVALGLLALSLIAGCSRSSSSEQCKAVCKRDAECVKELQDPEKTFDQGECTETCAALDRDEVGRQLIAKHLECVQAAPSCSAVRACD